MSDRQLPSPDQVTPFDPAACAHHTQLLWSWHCARPVLHQGCRYFIQGFSANTHGDQVTLVVYLCGVKGGIDSSQIETMPFRPEGM